MSSTLLQLLCGCFCAGEQKLGGGLWLSGGVPVCLQEISVSFNPIIQRHIPVWNPGEPQPQEPRSLWTTNGSWPDFLWIVRLKLTSWKLTRTCFELYGKWAAYMHLLMGSLVQMAGWEAPGMVLIRWIQTPPQQRKSPLQADKTLWKLKCSYACMIILESSKYARVVPILWMQKLQKVPFHHSKKDEIRGLSLLSDGSQLVT